MSVRIRSDRLRLAVATPLGLDCPDPSPRLFVSQRAHDLLSREARRRKTTIRAVADAVIERALGRGR